MASSLSCFLKRCSSVVLHIRCIAFIESMSEEDTSGDQLRLALSNECGASDDILDDSHNCLKCKKCDKYASACCRVTTGDDTWAIRLTCATCAHVAPQQHVQSHWHLCSTCSHPQRVPLVTDLQMQRHRHDYHRNKRNKTDINDTFDRASNGDFLPSSDEAPHNDAGDDELHLDDDTMSVSSSTPERQIVAILAPNAFSRTENTNFFDHDSLGPDLGRKYLVARSQTHLGSPPCAAWDAHDVELEYSLAQLSMTASRTQRELLAKILDLTVRQTEKNVTRTEVGLLYIPKVPRTPAALRCRIMEGKYALLPNLPHPEIRISQNFAYVSIIDCIRDLLAHGIKTDVIAPPAVPGLVTRCGESKRCLEILTNSSEVHGSDPSDTKLLTIWLIDWLDDFEANTVKTNRKSGVTKKTLTIAPPSESKNPILYTYPLALGPKQDSIEDVELFHCEELRLLSTSPGVEMYSQRDKGMVRVHAEMLVSLMDQPARRGANKLMLGNSQFAARFGYMFDYKAEASSVPSCAACQTSLQSTGESILNCQGCKSWRLDDPNLKLSYAVLVSAASEVFTKVSTNVWQPSAAKRFLLRHCINNEAQAEIIERASNRQSLNYVLSNNLGDKYPDLISLSEENPDSFQAYPVPALWQKPGLALHQNIEAIMHLLFLGLQKTCMLTAQTWLKGRRRFQPFLTYITGVPDSIQKLTLSWCKANPYGSGKFGGHVSENYLADCRLCPWYYSQLGDLAEEIEFVMPPADVPPEKWLKVTNVGWLKARGLPHHGQADEVKSRVAEEMEKPGGPCNILPPVGGDVENVYMMVCTLAALISRLMSPTVTALSIRSVERHIALFLNAFETLDKDLRTTVSDHAFIRHYNFVGLLNVPDVLREFGPLRDLWEGSYQGEGSIRDSKPKLVNGLQTNWSINLMAKELRMGALRRMGVRVYEDEEDNNEDNNEDLDEEQDNTANGTKMVKSPAPRMVKPFKSCADAVYAFTSGQPISCVMYDAKQLYCQCATRGGELVEIPIERGEFEREKVSLAYHKFQIATEEEGRFAASETRDREYCLLLPMLTPQGLPNQRSAYACITSNWHVMQKDGQLGPFRVPGCMYDDVHV